MALNLDFKRDTMSPENANKMVKAIDDMNSNISSKNLTSTEIDSNICTFNDEVVDSLNQVRLAKTGNVCCLAILGRFVESFTDVSDSRDVTVLTLKAGYRPIFTNYSQSVSVGASLWGGKTPQFSEATPEGVLKFKKGASGRYFAIYYTYITN